MERFTVTIFEEAGFPAVVTVTPDLEWGEAVTMLAVDLPERAVALGFTGIIENEDGEVLARRDREGFDFGRQAEREGEEA